MKPNLSLAGQHLLEALATEDISMSLPWSVALFTDLFSDEATELVVNGVALPRPTLSFPTVRHLQADGVFASPMYKESRDPAPFLYFARAIPPRLPGMHERIHFALFETWLRQNPVVHADLVHDFLWFHSHYMLYEVHEMPIKLDDYSIHLCKDRRFKAERVRSMSNIRLGIQPTLVRLFDNLCYAN